MGKEISRKRHGSLRMSKEGKTPKRRGLDRDHAQKESQTDPDRARRAQAAQREKQIFRGGEGKDGDLKERIEGVFYKNKERYGVRRVHASLRNDGIVANHKKIQRLMNEMGLSGKRKRQKYHSYIGEVGRIAENIINRDFISDGPNKKWTTDVSQFNCPFGKAYLSPILDMGMGDIVAWDLSLSPNLEQTNRMLDRAFSKYPNLEGLIMHRDWISIATGIL